MEKKRMIPKNVFDMEYATNWLREVDFLKGRNIFPSFEKTDKYGIVTYKYKKTPELFLALVRYYTIIECEHAMGKSEKASGAEKIGDKEVAPIVGTEKKFGKRNVITLPANGAPPSFAPTITHPISFHAVTVPSDASETKLSSSPQTVFVPVRTLNTVSNPDYGGNIIPFKTEDDIA